MTSLSVKAFLDRVLCPLSIGYSTQSMYIYLLCIYLQYIYFSLPYCCIHLNYRDINTIQLKSAAFHARNKALKAGKQKLIAPHLKRIFRRSKLFFDDFFFFLRDYLTIDEKCTMLLRFPCHDDVDIF